ncbi:MAG TPA: hypothetical protein VFV49_02950 [Thermoanaerobaculia bacterium]|nr:hypothetical protein [Thermoanaerobaculia bacterium]
MLGSAVFYSGLVLAAAGLFTRHRLRAVPTGIAIAVIGLLLPARETRVTPPVTRLDEFAPAWQFHEVHTMRVEAPPARVYEAIKQVRANEIRLFRTLTWIRRGGKEAPESILNAGDEKPLLDVATSSGFYYLADDAPREVVVQTRLGPSSFGTMNFLITPDGTGSIVSTETRVFARTPAARRQFAAYWRVIYPGSALIRRMWLRAIARRAVGM